MSTHIRIQTLDQGEMVWPIARVHLHHQPDDRPTGMPQGYDVISPENVMWAITETEYNRLADELCDPLDEEL